MAAIQAWGSRKASWRKLFSTEIGRMSVGEGKAVLDSRNMYKSKVETVSVCVCVCEIGRLQKEMIKVSRCSTCLPFVPSCYTLLCPALCPEADFYRLLLWLPCLSASSCIWPLRSPEGWLSEEERNSPGSSPIGSQ